MAVLTRGTRVRRRAPEPGHWEEALTRLVLRLGSATRGADGRAQPRGVFRVFALAERLVSRGHTIRLLRPGGLLRYEVAPLPGRELPLGGQAPVRHGERVVILHWENHNTAAMAETLGQWQTVTFQGSRAVRDELQALAQLAESGAIPPDARAVWAETVLYPTLARFGFSVRPAPRGPRTFFVRLYFLGLLALYGRGALANVSKRRRHRLRLGDAWIGLDVLRERYGAGAV